MKCLSLWQPWATLMAINAKHFETRSWSTSFRGQLAIHAAKKWNKELSELCGTEHFAHALSPPGRPTYDLPFGAIVGIVDVVDCVMITKDNTPDYPERAFGDYTPGRFMWETQLVCRFIKPIPFNGAQGLFEVPDALLGLTEL